MGNILKKMFDTLYKTFSWEISKSRKYLNTYKNILWILSRANIYPIVSYNISIRLFDKAKINSTNSSNVTSWSRWNRVLTYNLFTYSWYNLENFVSLNQNYL